MQPTLFRTKDVCAPFLVLRDFQDCLWNRQPVQQYHKTKNLISSGLIISSAYQCTHILPILEGRLDAKICKGINLGGSQAAGYLQRLLQLKYPGHLAAITLSRMEEILHEHSYIAEDYVEGKEEVGCLQPLDVGFRSVP